jgi:O-antigen/teichoic acid export membrane protein
MLGGLVVGAGLLIPFAARTFGWKVDQPTKDEIHSVWEFARWSIPQSLLGRVYSRLDILLLGFILGPTPVGWYEVAWKVVLPSGIISQVASDGLMTSVAVEGTGGKEINEKFTNRIRQTLDAGSFLAIPAFFGSLVIGKPLLTEVFGVAYESATPFLVGLAVFQVIVTQTTPLIQTLNGIDKVRVTVPITAVTLAINALLGFALITTIGPVGVVVATIIAQVVQYILSLVALMRTVGTFLPITRLHIVEIIAGLSMAIVLYLIPVQIEGNIIVASSVVLGSFIYFSIILSLSKRSRNFVQRQIV